MERFAKRKLLGAVGNTGNKCMRRLIRLSRTEQGEKVHCTSVNPIL